MITVCDISALSRWAEKDLARRLGPPLEQPEGWSLPCASSLDEAILRAARLEATPVRPLHILVCAEDRRIRTPVLRNHIWSTPLPAGALYQLTPEVLLASPRFCLQQMAPRSSLARTASIATEICGTYARSPRSPEGFFRRAPLDTACDLRAYFDATRGYGAGRVREALPYVVDGSRSPMETVLVLALVLPVELGGCGLPLPTLNQRIEIPPELRLALGKPYVTVDICWPGTRTILEYDSYRWHTVPRALDSDASRSEGLRDLGWMVRSVTDGLLEDDAALRLLTDRVAARFGRSLPHDDDFILLRRSLVNELMRV